MLYASIGTVLTRNALPLTALLVLKLVKISLLYSLHHFPCHGMLLFLLLFV